MGQIIKELEQLISSYEQYAEEDENKKEMYEGQKDTAMSYFMDGRVTTYKFAIRDLKKLLGGLKDETTMV